MRSLAIALVVLLVACGRDAPPPPGPPPPPRVATSGPVVPTPDENFCMRALACCLAMDDDGIPCSRARPFSERSRAECEEVMAAGRAAAAAPNPSPYVVRDCR